MTEMTDSARPTGGVPVMASAAQDPRWEWIEVSTLGGESHWIKGACRHTDVVPVESGGEVVAHLCKTCDQQLPEEWTR